MEIGRARLRSLAPEWTDHNVHDPGITLMELLAWTCEAQLYSLSHIRKDERAAYAALFGLTPAGARAAHGIIWPDRTDPNSPASTFSRNIVISEELPVRLTDSDIPTFRSTQKILWTPGRIISLLTRHTDGHTTDHTRVNERGGAPFFPFGSTFGRDVLTMTFAFHDPGGLLGADPAAAKSAYWAIGVRSASAQRVGASDDGATQVEATLVAGGRRLPLRVAFDSSHGLQTTGVLLLDLTNVTTKAAQLTLELRPTAALAAPPSVLRIEPNVMPIEQSRKVQDKFSNEGGKPDWHFQLNESPLAFPMGSNPVTVEVAQGGDVEVWTQRDQFSDCGPADKVYTFDPKRREVRFGNGVNGRIPDAQATVFVTYIVSGGEHGNTAPNRRWRVPGISGVFGINVDAITGGAAATDLHGQRRTARERVQHDHPLVTTEDIVKAAKKLPFLRVVRAWIVARSDEAPDIGTVTLIAMRQRPDGVEPSDIPESRRWLHAVRRRLAGRMLLGSRLIVTAPRYVPFAIQAAVEAKAGRDPKAIEDAIRRQLRVRLALTTSSNSAIVRQPGVDVSMNDLKAWILATEGVARIVDLKLFHDQERSLEEVVVPRNGLPRWNDAQSIIDVNRPAQGGRR